MEEEEEEGELGHEQVMLGFLEEPQDATALLRHRFRSKSGGRPAWLNPLDLPALSQLQCSITRSPLQFLLQVYAPVDHEATAFHRCMFVFISTAGSKLTTPGAVRAFRCQLPRDNPFYSNVPDDSRAPPQVDGQPAQDPWQVAQAEAAVRQGNSPAEQAGMALFTEHELVVEPEEEPPSRGIAGLLAQQRLDAAAGSSPPDAGPLDAESQEMMDSVEAQATPQQQAFARFAARVAWAPQQVLRYDFAEGAKPLWPSIEGLPTQGSVPRCPHCNARRHFEFQVMPQLINYLGVDASSNTAPDWGTIAVYSCPASCQTPAAYAEEFVWVQAS